MAITTTADRSPAADAVRIPSVLVALVTHDAARWLRECLQSLAAQTHPRLGVVAVDNGSTDDTRELLVHALGEGRVVALEANRGLAGALRAVSELPAAQAADYLLILHDDTAIAPDAVARLVDAAEGIKGVERVGVVGPKVVDWEDPRVLREVGRSTDRFGHPYTPLQDGELDQGQYDRVLEVLFVSSCAMLVSREAWQRTGMFDERYAGHYDDLDFCWRARLAGFRVLMTPLATARHMDAATHGERDEGRRRSSRYYGERAALASMLKDYGVLTLLWLLPVYTVLGLARLVFLALSRRFEDAYDLIAAWGWNLLHLPGTIRRRVRAQSVRSVRDRSVRRFMASTFRLPRWFERAEEFLDEGLEELEDEEFGRPLPRRAASMAAGHPVLVGTAIAIVVGAFSLRHLIGPEVLSGGALASFPATAEGFFTELVSGVRTTILGGAQPASPALAGLGSATWVAFGSAASGPEVPPGRAAPRRGGRHLPIVRPADGPAGRRGGSGGRVRAIGRSDVVLLRGPAADARLPRRPALRVGPARRRLLPTEARAAHPVRRGARRGRGRRHRVHAWVGPPPRADGGGLRPARPAARPGDRSRAPRGPGGRRPRVPGRRRRRGRSGRDPVVLPGYHGCLVDPAAGARRRFRNVDGRGVPARSRRRSGS